MRQRKTENNINMVMRIARTRKRMTQADLAAATGKYLNPPLTEHAIWNIENGKKKPRIRTQKAIAAALEVDINEIFPLEMDEEQEESLSDRDKLPIPA